MSKKSNRDRNPRPYDRGLVDLANVIAQETCGIQGAIPEQEDYDLAQKFLKEINSRYDEED